MSHLWHQDVPNREELKLILARIKNALDPGNIANPARFVNIEKEDWIRYK